MSGGVLAILQARFSSSRLPGKVLEPILGRPMLARQIERLRRCRSFDHLIVATSDSPSDDLLAKLCAEMHIDCFRGNLDDVLDRFYQCARLHEPEYVVRLTGDCPLSDPALIDETVAACIRDKADYASNVLVPTYPDGLDVEVFRFDRLAEAWREAKLPSQREHVTLFLHQQPKRFKLTGVKAAVDRSHMRWTVDEPADLAFVRRIYEELYPADPAFSTDDILALLERHPELAKINAQFHRNEGLEASLLRDASKDPS